VCYVELVSHVHRNAGYQPTCVVAGAGPGLGLAIAERYASEGFLAYVLLRRPERLVSGIAALRERGLDIVSLACDVASVASVEGALRRIRRHSGRCDVLIYNAFAAASGHASALKPETIVSEFRTNVAGALAFVNATVDEMRSRSNGAIFFSGCGLAQKPSKEFTSLSVGKAALRALVDCVADETERDGIRVGMVTIDGTMPTHELELKRIAELYWELFTMSERSRKRELLFRVKASSFD
jgi:NAD(P)-dependent dehydrogenase (short-subunit alcohol dehydrogenase family)